MRFSGKLKIFTSFLLVLIAVAGLALFYVAHLAAKPWPSKVGAPPGPPYGAAVSFQTEDAVWLHGWLYPGKPHRGAVLLVHGHQENLTSMYRQAQILNEAGCAVLLIDLRAHGESGGDTVTYGLKEQEDIRTAVQNLRSMFPSERIGLVGFSLGGAATLMNRRPLPVDALVLESVFPTLEDAVQNRVRLFFPPWLAGLTTQTLKLAAPLYLGYSMNDIRPVDRLPSLTIPTMIIGGDADDRVTVAQTEQMFRAVAISEKQLWLVAGAGHEDIAHYDPRGFREHVLPFLLNHLTTP